MEQHIDESGFTMIEPPIWHLFERMQFALLQNQSSNSKDFSKLQQQHAQQRIIRLEKDKFQQTYILAALEALKVSGGELCLPEGECLLNEPLYLASGVYISGVAERTHLIFKDLDYGIYILGTPEQKICNVGLKNLHIQHQGEHKFCSAILVSHAKKVVFEQITLSSPRGVGFLLADKVQQTDFLNCHVRCAGLVGYMLVRDVHETLLRDCSAEYCQQSGVFLTDLKLPEHIEALDFVAQLHYTDHVIGNFGPFAAHDPSPYRTDIINCVFRHNRKMGITTDGVGYLSVKNSVIANNDCEGITIDNGSWGCSILGCHIYNNGWRGNQHPVELGIDFVNEMGLMEDGSSKAKLPGISLDNAAFTRVENNHIECNWGDGVKLVRAAYANTVQHNLIENNNIGVNDRFHYFGVLVGVAVRQHPEQDDFASCNNQIIANDILGAHFAGIHLMGGVSGNIVNRNHITGATFLAIEDHEQKANLILPINFV